MAACNFINSAQIGAIGLLSLMDQRRHSTGSGVFAPFSLLGPFFFLLLLLEEIPRGWKCDSKEIKKRKKSPFEAVSICFILPLSTCRLLMDFKSPMQTAVFIPCSSTQIVWQLGGNRNTISGFRLNLKNQHLMSIHIKLIQLNGSRWNRMSGQCQVD